MHSHVPLSCHPSWDSERLLSPLYFLFPGPFHTIEGLLPGGLSKVRVSLSPGIRWMLPPRMSKSAFTVEGAGHLCHTHYPQGERKKPGNQECLFITPVPAFLFPPTPSCPPQTQKGLPSPSSSPPSLPLLSLLSLLLLPIAPALLFSRL